MLGEGVPMCRLLGVVAERPAPLADLLAGDLEPFRALAAEHRDGWGIAAHAAGAAGPVVRRGVERAHECAGFAAAVAATRTDAALLHLRLASAGSAVVERNTHPFAGDGLALAHNGYFGPRSAVDALLADGGAGCLGETDSERLFALVRDRLRAGDVEPHRALHDAAARIAGVASVEALNLLLLTPDALYAYARYEPQVVCARGGDGLSYGMSYRRDRTPDGGRRVVVASNGWDQPGPAWRPLPNGCVLEVTRTGTVTLHDLGAWRRAA